MLSPTTFESFRVYSLGTAARLHEALRLIHDVQRDRIPRDALSPIFLELCWSLAKDPVVKLRVQSEIQILRERIADSKTSLANIDANIKLIIRLIEDNYKEDLEANILEIISDPSKRIELRQN